MFRSIEPSGGVDQPTGELPERFTFKWEQFDGMDFSFRPGKYRSAIRRSGEDFDAAGAEKTSKPENKKLLKTLIELRSCELALSRSGQRRARLTVPAPRRLTLLARPPNTGVQTIPFEGEPLYSSGSYRLKRST